MWSKVSCLRKQHDGGDWASNHLKSNVLTTTPPRPTLKLEKETRKYDARGRGKSGAVARKVRIRPETG